jgi:hypothetical protein
MWGKKFSIHLHIGSRCTQIASCSFIFSITAQQLHFDGYRKILVSAHAFRGLSMHHDATVAKGPTRTFLGLITHKPVFQSDAIVTEGFVVKKVPELFIELIVGIVSDNQLTVFHPEGVSKIIARSMVPDFGFPFAEVLSIKHGLPLLFRRGLGVQGDIVEHQTEGNQ